MIDKPPALLATILASLLLTGPLLFLLVGIVSVPLALIGWDLFAAVGVFRIFGLCCVVAFALMYRYVLVKKE